MSLENYNVQSRLTEEMRTFLQNRPEDEQLKVLLIEKNAIKKVHLILEKEVNELAQAEKKEQKNQLINQHLEQQLITDLYEIETIIPSQEQKLDEDKKRLKNDLRNLQTERSDIQRQINTARTTIDNLTIKINNLKQGIAHLNPSHSHDHPSKHIHSHITPITSTHHQQHSAQAPNVHSHQETAQIQLPYQLLALTTELNNHQNLIIQNNVQLTANTQQINSNENKINKNEQQLAQLSQQRAACTARIAAYENINADLHKKLPASNYEKLLQAIQQCEQKITVQANTLIKTARDLNHDEFIIQIKIVFSEDSEIHQLARLIAEHTKLTLNLEQIENQLKETRQNITKQNQAINNFNDKIIKLDNNNLTLNNNNQKLNEELASLIVFKAHNKKWRNNYGKMILGALAINLLTSLPYFLNLGLFIPALPIAPLLIPALMFISLAATIIATAMTLNYAIRYWHNNWQINNNEKQVERITAQIKEESAARKEINETRLPRCKQLLKKDCEEEEKLVVHVSILKQAAEDILKKAGTLAYPNARLPSLSPVTSAASFFQIPIAEAIIIDDIYKEPSAPEHSFENLSPR